jgi:hypothetical protein
MVEDPIGVRMMWLPCRAEKRDLSCRMADLGEFWLKCNELYWLTTIFADLVAFAPFPRDFDKFGYARLPRGPVKNTGRKLRSNVN